MKYTILHENDGQEWYWAVDESGDTVRGTHSHTRTETIENLKRVHAGLSPREKVGEIDLPDKVNA